MNQSTAGASHFSVQFLGLGLGWALLAVVALTLATGWSYSQAKPSLSRWRWLQLTALRSFVLALFIILLTRPVLFTTLTEKVRGELLVLVDLSQSMNLKDGRTGPDDLARAGIALGMIDPTGGLSQKLSDDDAKKAAGISRLELVQAMSANAKLDLWSKLDEKADLAFYGLGRDLIDLGDPRQGSAQHLDADAAGTFFKGLEANATGTAIGDALRLLLQQKKGDPIAGVLLISDGGNNVGMSPSEAADLAREANIPLYIYGVGITSPVDISVSGLEGPSVIQAKEKAVFTVQVRGLGVNGRRVALVLKAKGQQVDQKTVIFSDETAHTFQLSYVPPFVGEVNLEASITPIPGEVVKTNNRVVAHVHVVDQKLRVLMVDEYQSWDFQYLLAMLQRDRRVAVKAVLFDGDPGLFNEPNSPYLETMPLTKAELYPYQVVILGDVNPSALRENRMKMLADWVEKSEGGLIFRAGPRYDPAGYRHTPLEPLIPVYVQGVHGTSAGLYTEAVHLELTPEGEVSSLLRLADDPIANLALWREFPGVFWTAWIGRAKPGAQSLLADPTSTRRTSAGPMPVIAVQPYGSGKSIYVGFRETYRWRSDKGEKYFTRIWNQLIQAISATTIGKSGIVRLRSDRSHYQVGDRIVISGTIYESSFEPSRELSIAGSIRVQPDAAPNTLPSPATAMDLRLTSSADQPGKFSGEMIATVAGTYSFTVPRDPTSPVDFDVSPPANLEEADTAMNAKLLQQLADTTNGRFVREEELAKLPQWITSHGATLKVDRKIDLIFSPWILVLMLALFGVEWLLRRLSKLK